MDKIKVNLTFEGFSLHKVLVISVIKKCIAATLKAEKVNTPCEINVLVTNDQGIRAINKASRNIDKATDVLSFPMFQLEAGAPPADWSASLLSSSFRPRSRPQQLPAGECSACAPGASDQQSTYMTKSSHVYSLTTIHYHTSNFASTQNS